ncbi:MAG: hypothetical protein RR253_08145, partial [Oscillospiraceae bacterium]
MRGQIIKNLWKKSGFKGDYSLQSASCTKGDYSLQSASETKENFIDKSLDNKGMALVTVIGILGVIAVLATGMFYFSSNELNFSKMDSGRVQAEYLARAGVEIASKSFPGVSDKFTNVTKTSPVEMTLYLTVTTDSKGKTQTELVRNK